MILAWFRRWREHATPEAKGSWGKQERQVVAALRLNPDMTGSRIAGRLNLSNLATLRILMRLEKSGDVVSYVEAGKPRRYRLAEMEQPREG